MPSNYKEIFLQRKKDRELHNNRSNLERRCRAEKFTERHTEEDELEVYDGEMQDEELQRREERNSAAEKRGLKD